MVPGKLGLGAGHIAPFSESLAPPGIVLRDGVELGQVEGNRPHVAVDLGRGVLRSCKRLHELFSLETLRCGSGRRLHEVQELSHGQRVFTNGGDFASGLRS